MPVCKYKTNGEDSCGQRGSGATTDMNNMKELSAQQVEDRQMLSASVRSRRRCASVALCSVQLSNFFLSCSKLRQTLSRLQPIRDKLYVGNSPLLAAASMPSRFRYPGSISMTAIRRAKVAQSRCRYCLSLVT